MDGRKGAWRGQREREKRKNASVCFANAASIERDRKIKDSFELSRKHAEKPKTLQKKEKSTLFCDSKRQLERCPQMIGEE